MKQLIFASLLFITAFDVSTSFAQETKDGFDFNKMFAGGSVVLGLGFGNNSQLTLGGNPEIGYSIHKNVDLGICGNYIYSSSSVFDGYYTSKTNITQIGLGFFGRIHFSDNFFVHLQPEFNNIKYRQFVKETNVDIIPDTTLRSSSFLAGIGYGTRDIGNFNFFTLIMVDLRKDLYSPYRSYNGSISPIIRSGFNFYFGRKKK
jgi:hypothetical protein